jgi:hypothetical protein
LYSAFEDSKAVLEELRLDHVKDEVDPQFDEKNFSAKYYLGKQGWLRMVVFEDGTILFKAYSENTQIGETSTKVSQLASFIPNLENWLEGFSRNRIPRKIENPDREFLKSIGIQGKLKILANMTTVCAWCGKYKDRAGNWVEQLDSISEPLTHGICPSCAAEVRKQFNAKLRILSHKS